MSQPEFIAEYLVAFKEANPGSPVPSLSYVKGWVEFRTPYLVRYRKKQILAMTSLLQYRIREKAAKAETP